MAPVDLQPAAAPLLLVLLGPTGSGKSSLAVAVAQRFVGEIVSCDSVAVYRYLEIGSAKPTPAQRAAAPHHLLDMLPPTGAMTAGDWARAARAAVHAIAARGHLPIVTGGTGLYLRAFTQGLAPLPQRCPALRARLQDSARHRGSAHLQRLLARLDPTAAARIHANDEPKLIRAIEIALLTRPSDAKSPARDSLTGFRLLRLGLNPPRAALYQRLNERASAMFDEGLLEETRLLQQAYGTDAQALGALGYREAAAVLADRLTLPEARTAVQQGHRNYAKRQMTWFRKEPDVLWLDTFGDTPEALRQAAAAVQAALTARPD